jgi:hypothetical protein
MQSKAKTVKEYLAELPPERRKAMETLHKVVMKNLPKGYEETMQYGMIAYVVPLKTYPQGYLGNKNIAIGIGGLASQKNYMSLYLLNIYSDKKTEKWFKDAYKKSGKKLDMGKSCIRFKRVEDLPLDVIGKAISMTSVKEMIKMYESGRRK